jgi:hypothetical protein
MHLFLIKNSWPDVFYIPSATHFNKLITTYPPQTSSRFAASQWLCTMHNKVNERLKKPIFDCSDIDSKYPCGCADEATEASD